MNIYSQLNKAVDYLENNLEGNINYKKLQEFWEQTSIPQNNYLSY